MKNKLKILFSILIGILLLNYNAVAQGFQWKIGEELNYNVKWTFIHLGKLKLQICDTLRMDQKKVYHTKLYLDSNPLLFFVNMHSVFESYIDEDFYPHLFLAEEKIDGVRYDTRYRFNYEGNVIEVKMTDIKDTPNNKKSKDN